MQFRMRYKSSVIGIMVFTMLALTISLSGAVWLVSSRVAEDVASQLFSGTSLHAKSGIEDVLDRAMSRAAQGAQHIDVVNLPAEGRLSAHLPLIVENLRQNGSLYSLYYGYETGDFFQVIAVRDFVEVLNQHKAPASTSWIVRTITSDKSSNIREQKWSFLDGQLQHLGGYVEQFPDYDPRERPWYQGSLESEKTRLTSPYIFSSLQRPGITAARGLPNGIGVYGVDLTLDGLARIVNATDISPNGSLIILDGNGRYLAGSGSIGRRHDPVMALDRSKHALFDVADQALTGNSRGKLQDIDSSGESWLVSYEKISFPGSDFSIIVAAPKQDFNDFFSLLQRQVFLVGFVGVVVFGSLAYWLSSRLVRQFNRLTSRVEHAKRMMPDDGPDQTSHIIEFDELLDSFQSMSKDLAVQAKTLFAEQEKLARIVELGIAMSAEKDSEKLMEMLLTGAKELANADGGSLYILGEDKKLSFQIVLNDSLGIAMGGTSGNEVKIPPVSMYRNDGSANHSNVVSHAVHTEKMVNIPDAYNDDEFDFSGTRIFDANNNYRSQSFLTVPLKPRGGDTIGAMQLINSRKPGTNEIQPFDASIEGFVEALAAQASTAMYNKDLLQAQEDLMDALIKLIAGAVDAKSPYTGGHCERVPELAQMLARAAQEETTGPMADFAFNSRDEWREFQVGTWLHDCGKVTTPEYVVDKATKLETIYNRIHEVRARFEVLLRDADIDRLTSIVEGGDPFAAQSIFDTKKAQLLDDFAFLAQCNIGGEFMADEDIERLKSIANTEWVRHFDIKLGLSHDEGKRFANEPDGPVREKLLDDKVCHIVPRERPVEDLYKDYGFKMEVPEHLYNQGELYNMSVRRGTLSAEERFKINEHVMQTIVMLDQLPLPPHLKRVPEYAGTHHETLIGTGYPRQLTGDDLSIPARIMAVADIFEALTASDRPYKKAKTLSESIKILSFFKKDRHICGEVFDFFLTSGVYLDYAQKYLLPDQIDEVDVNQYLG